jgi:hypothetical protein
MAEWISVKDRLPEENGRYLCYVKAKRRTGFIGTYGFVENLHEFDEMFFKGENRSGFITDDDRLGFVEIENVTHWMPLPEPPKMG